MSEEAKKMRMDRISRLFHELRYEIERGFMEGEVDESLVFEFIVPVSRELKGGSVHCRFESRPVHRDSIYENSLMFEPRLRVIK